MSEKKRSCKRNREFGLFYKLKTISPNGLNDTDGFYVQNRKTRKSAHKVKNSIMYLGFLVSEDCANTSHVFDIK